MGASPRWDPALYAANTGHHRAFDQWFLESTPLAAGQRIVDLGCGSGDFTRVLAAEVGDGVVVGVDPNAGFVEEAARRARPNQRFVVGSAQTLAEVLGDERFDGVVSRAALQWAPCADQPLIARQVLAVLRPGGWFRLDMSGEGNIARVVRLLDDVAERFDGPRMPWCFASPSTAFETLEEAGFDLDTGHVRSVVQRRPFDAATLWGWLESQVLIAYEARMPEASHQAFRATVRGRLDELRRADGTYDQTFVRLDVLAHRPPG